MLGEMNDPIAPGFLIAVPQLLDPNFKQSVVLLLQHNEEGALGVVVNQESPLLLSDLCRDHAIAYVGPSRKRVRRGGPVQPDQGLVLYGEEHKDPEGREGAEWFNASFIATPEWRCISIPFSRFRCVSRGADGKLDLFG